jgi:uncharacterized protein
MRRSDKEIKSREEIEAVIKKATVCRLGLCDGDMPYVVPVNFGFQGNSLFFHSARDGRKLDIIRRNNNICFETDTDQEFVQAEKGCGWSMKYRSVIGFGKAFFVENPADKIAALKIIMAHYSDKEYDFSESDADKVAIVRIDIESLTGKKSGY